MHQITSRIRLFFGEIAFALASFFFNCTDHNKICALKTKENTPKRFRERGRRNSGPSDVIAR